MVILKGPFEVVVGLLYGALVGALCWVLPESSHKVAHVLRLAMVFFAGLFALFASQMVRHMYFPHQCLPNGVGFSLPYCFFTFPAQCGGL